jgi:hypothetical protein
MPLRHARNHRLPHHAQPQCPQRATRGPGARHPHHTTCGPDTLTVPCAAPMPDTPTKPRGASSPSLQPHHTRHRRLLFPCPVVCLLSQRTPGCSTRGISTDELPPLAAALRSSSWFMLLVLSIPTTTWGNCRPSNGKSHSMHMRTKSDKVVLTHSAELSCCSC